MKSFSHHMAAFVERLEAREFLSRHCVTTGIDALNRLEVNFRPGRLSLITGNVASGKTSLATQIALHAVTKENAVCAIYSQGGSPHRYVRQMLSDISEIAIDRYVAGDLDESELDRLTISIGDLHEASLWIEDNVLTTRQICDQVLEDRTFRCGVKSRLLILDNFAADGHSDPLRLALELDILTELAIALSLPIVIVMTGGDAAEVDGTDSGTRSRFRPTWAPYFDLTINLGTPDRDADAPTPVTITSKGKKQSAAISFNSSFSRFQ